MKLRAIYSFEVGYQIRRAWFWLFAAALFVVAILLTRDASLSEALREEFFVNSPFSVAKTTVVGGLLWLVVAAAVAGEAAARDVSIGQHPLTYTAPISKADYLAGRFLAAFALNAALLLVVQVGILVGTYAPGVDPVAIGPFRPAAYLTSYAFLALPNAYFVTALQFWLAARTGRPMAGYVASFLLIFIGFFVASLLLFHRGVGRLLDPIGIRFVLDELSHLWTTYEKSWRLLSLDGVVLQNRLFWLIVGTCSLALAGLGFRFAHPVQASRRWLRKRRPDETTVNPVEFGVTASRETVIPRVRRASGISMHARQTLAIAGSSFLAISTSWTGRGVLIAVPLLSIPVVIDQMVAGGGPLLPNTLLVTRELTGSLSDELSRWIFVPFLIAYFAGELIWRERDAGMAEITDAMPGSEWPPFIGKVLGLGLFLTLFVALIMVAGIASQAIMGYREFEVALYLKILLGLQLPEYLLFVPLAMVAHAVVNQKYIGHLVAMLAYVIVVLAPMFGIEHDLLIYGAGPRWSYTYLRGFGGSIWPWLWFKLYWLAWALVLSVVASLLWARGLDGAIRPRLQNARRRMSGSTAIVGGIAVGLVLTLGGFIFYNTNVLHAYRAPAEIAERQAEYERLFGQYRDVPQPELTYANLRVEIRADERAVEVRGFFHMLNRTSVVIDTVHLALNPGMEPEHLAFDRRARLVPADRDLHHRIYVLEEALQPGDSLRLGFRLEVSPAGFSERGANLAVSPRASFFDVRGWLPAIGYQSTRELTSAAERRKYGLPPRPIIPALEDAEVRQDRGVGIVLETVVGTTLDQVAVAPGALRRSWTEGGRRYFHYATDGPIGSEWSVASADYGVQEERWSDPTGRHEDVQVRIYHHPAHDAHLDALLRGIRSSLDYYTTEIGPYPYGHLTFLEIPAIGTGMHAAASVVTFTEGSVFWRQSSDRDRFDFPFAVVAHEMAHQWSVPSAFVEGAPILSESVAWYYAMRLVEATYGHEVHRLLRFMRQPYPHPPIRRGEPLLRGLDPYVAYRKGPFALHALREYLGEEAVNGALRSLFEKHEASGAPSATTLDLYRELGAVTPDSMRHLLHDLFEVNAFWGFEAQRVKAGQTDDGHWEVTLEVRAQKIVADRTGAETEMPLDEWIEIGVFGRPRPGRLELSAPLYVGRHRIHSGSQVITVTVPEEPYLAGIDPYHVLDWEEGEDDDNVREVEIAMSRSESQSTPR